MYSDYKKNDYFNNSVTSEKLDLEISFIHHPISKDIAKVKNIEAIKSSLKILVLLNHYEKPFHPDIGCDIYKSLFELIDMPGTEELMTEYITETIEKYEPRVILNDVFVHVMPDQNNVEISILFTPQNSTEEITMKMFLRILH